MKGASRWLDACAGVAQGPASAAAKSAAAIAFDNGRCRIALDMESLLVRSLKRRPAPPAAARSADTPMGSAAGRTRYTGAGPEWMQRPNARRVRGADKARCGGCEAATA